MNDCCNPVCAPADTRFIPGYMGFTAFAPVVPASYWNVKSEEQRYFRMCEQISKLICYAQVMGEKINLNREDIEELEEQFEKFLESGFEEYYEKQLAEWIDEHMPDIIEQAIKMVFFGLTDDGYFTAWIPNSWQGILFGTVADYASDDYGCLTLDY